MRFLVALLVVPMLGCTTAEAPDDAAEEVSGPVLKLKPIPAPEPRTRLARLRSTTSGVVEGADISWPQCPEGVGIPSRPGQGQPMPRKRARFVVVGLTNGPAFHRNPCIADQVAWIRKRGLAVAAYAVANYPVPRRLRQYGDAGPYDATRRLGRLGNVGYAQAGFNLTTMRRVGIDSPVVWVDVEPFPSFPWSRNVSANQAVVKGILRRYREERLKVGFYSAQSLWREVLGPARFSLPEWRTAGRLGRADALDRCRRSYRFQGGRAVLSQWYTDHYDYNVTCPGTQLEDWFDLP